MKRTVSLGITEPPPVPQAQLQLAGYVRATRGELVEVYLKPRPIVELRTIIRKLNESEVADDD